MSGSYLSINPDVRSQDYPDHYTSLTRIMQVAHRPSLRLRKQLLDSQLP